MNQLLAVCLFFFLYASPVQSPRSASQPASQAAPDAASDELVTLTNAWNDAINANDRAKLESFLAPEFALYTWSGKLWTTRSPWLDNVRRYSDSALREISPRVYGDFAVVTSSSTFVVTDDGQSSSKTAVLVDTWRRTNGRWQVVARKSCRVSPTSASTASPCSP
jgi:ketosteroid isomerase-like protein